MAWRRDESSSFISGSTIYAYTEVDWNVGASRCTYTHLGGVTSPYYWDTSATGTLFWREWSGGAWGAWNEYASGTAYFGGYGDKELVRTDDFFTRQAADREVQLSCDVTAAGGTGSAWLTYTVPHLPNAPASITATRVSDNQVTVSWTAPTRSYDAMCLEVSIDGGSWSEFTQLWNASTSTTYSQASADHSYRFRARAYYQSAYSDYTSPTAAVAMTPSAPQSISVAASGGTNVAVTLTNNSPVATSLEYQTSTDGGSTWSASTTVSGSPVTSFSTSVSGTALIRVRNKNATGVSDWLVSDPITTICPPAPPTLRTPSGSVYDMAQGDIEFSWLHNSLDGSTQTAYELRYAINGGAWTTLSGTTAQSRTVSIGTFSAGNAVTWQVRTKGADANYSDWSQTGAFNVYTAPTLSITSPGATITGMPISLAATYSDMAGFTCQAATVSLQKDGRTLYSEPATISGTSITASLDVSEFLPTNGESYTVVVTARSSSSLSTTANTTFSVNFTEPVEGTLQVQNDPDTGYASLLATFDNSASEITYTGSTNAQYESTEGYVRSLTVDGKSEKWNQLYQCPRSGSYTENGITRTWGDENFITFSGNANGTHGHWYLNNATWPMTFYANHKYAMFMEPTGTPNNNVELRFLPTSTSVTNGGAIFTPTETTSTNGTFRIFIYVGTNVGSSYTVRVSLYDLTAMFGAGNEPATVEAFKATDVYKAKLAAGELYAYDAGSLVSIEGVEVRGRNLLRVDSGLTAITSGAFSNTTPRSFSEGQVWVGITSNNYFYNNNITSYTISDGSATFTTTTSGYGLGFPVRVSAGTTVTLSWSGGKPIRLGFFTDDGEYISTLGADLTSPRTETMPANTGWLLVVLKPAAANTETTYTDIMLELGSTAHAYEPYSLTTITTPLRSAGSVHDQLQADADNWTVERKVGTRAYQAGDESDPDVLTDGTNTYYALTTPTTDTPTSMSTIEIGSAFTVATDLDSTFSMTTWDGSADAVSVSVSRVNPDGTSTPLLTDGQSGAGIVDRFAPLNTDYQYAITTKAVSQAVKTVYVTNRIDSLYWFAYWGENVAKAKWNPDNGGIQVTRPQKTRVYYAGRRDPVSYDGHAVALNETPSWMFIGKDEVDTFVKLIEDGGRGVYKSCDGWVYHADFDLTLTPKYTAIGYYGGASLGITRIAGERL